MFKEAYSKLTTKTKNHAAWLYQNKFNFLLYIVYTVPFLMCVSGDIGYSVLIAVGIISAGLINKDKLNHCGTTVAKNVAFLIYSIIMLVFYGYGILFSMVGLYFCSFVWRKLAIEKGYFIDTIIAPLSAVVVCEVILARSFSWFAILFMNTLNQNSFSHIAFIVEFLIFYFIFRMVKSVLEENTLTYHIYSCIVLLFTALIGVSLVHSAIAFCVSITLLLVNIIYIISKYKKIDLTFSTPQNIRIKNALYYFLAAFFAIGVFAVLSVFVVENSAGLYGYLSLAFSSITH